MNLKIFAVFNKDGTPKGFYPSNVWPTPPEGATEISPDDWQEFLDYQGQRRWDGHQVVEYTPPPSPAPTQTPPSREVMKLLQEGQAMNEAILGAIRAWAGLENAMASLMGTIITQGGGSLGMAIYYRPGSTEIRLGIVDEAVLHFCASHNGGGSVKPLWEKLLKRVNRCKVTRNKIVHGDVSTIAMAGTGNHIRLTAPIFNFASNNRDRVQMIKNAEAVARGDYRLQLPGMSANDVKNAGANFFELGRMVNELRLVFRQMQRMKPQPEVFHKKLQRLSTHLMAEAGCKDDLTPSTP